MRLSLPVCVGMSVVALLAVVGPCGAQSKAAPVDERLFALYILDELYHAPLPQRAATDRTGLRHQANMAAFVARRRLLFDAFRRHYEKKKLDADIFDLYRAFERELDLWNGYQEKSTAARLAFDQAMGWGQNRAQQQLTGASLLFGLSLLAGDSTEDAAAALANVARVAAAERARLTLLQQQALQRLQQDLKAAADEYGPRIAQTRKTNYTAFVEATRELRSKHDWKDADFTHDHEKDARLIADLPGTGTGSAASSSNPFRLVATLKMDKSASREELLEQSAVCQRAADMVPPGKIHDFFRASFLAAAGELANNAALKDLGSTGFSSAIKNPPRAAAVAMKIWQRYLRYEGGVNDQILHKFIQACGCAGKPLPAYQLIAANCFQAQRGRKPTLNPSMSAVPAFWYDCARITSLVGDVNASAQCLQQAVRLGFRDYEAAKIDPDLRNVREHPSTSRQFQAVIR